MNSNLIIPRELLTTFCRKHGIKRLAVFGSALEETFGAESDVDLLVEFNAGQVPTLFDLAGMEMELSGLFSGRKVDLRTPEDLSRYFRDRVIEQAEVQYAE